jgi:hypothetical protein
MHKRGRFYAESTGALALLRIMHSKRWYVLCVYRHCFYCQDGNGDIICIGTERIGRGPINICGKSLTALLEIGISAGDVLHSENSCLRFENNWCLIDLSIAKIWDATFHPSRKPRSSLKRDVELLTELAHRDAPRESLGRLIPSILSDSLRSFHIVSARSQFQQLLIDRVVGVMKKIYHAERYNLQEDALRDLAGNLAPLIGVGFGLTPSGDDFCSGAILGIALMDDSRKARDLAKLLKREAIRKTTRISYAYYTSLAESYISESQAKLLNSFGYSEGDELDAILVDCANHGSTSGWDMLAGFAFGVELVKKQCETSRIGCEMACVC